MIDPTLNNIADGFSAIISMKKETPQKRIGLSPFIIAGLIVLGVVIVYELFKPKAI